MMVSILSCGDVTTVELRKNGIYCAVTGSRKNFPVMLLAKAIFKYFKIKKPATVGAGGLQYSNERIIK